MCAASYLPGVVFSDQLVHAGQVGLQDGAVVVDDVVRLLGDEERRRRKLFPVAIHDSCMGQK